MFYDVKSPVCLSSSDELIRKHRGYDVSNDVVALRERIGYARPLPNDVTVCDNIRALLPNHYLNATACAVTRFFPTRDTSLRHGRRQPLEIGNLIDRCIERVERITREYAKHADIVCPLSSGTDSRANLAILKLYVPNLACYTFRHPGFTDQTGDYYIPPKLCELTGLSHISIDDLTAPTQYVNSVREIVGQYHSQSTINLAYTLNSTLRGKTLIDGNILQYVAKAVIGYTLPPQLATTRLFVERYNGGSRILTDIVSAWVQDIRDNGCHNEIFDLFGVESSCGRWGAQTSAIYAATGVATLSIFNCIDVIEDLMQIPARLRRDNIVHRRILTKLAPELASLPFNPGQKTLTLRLRMSAPYTLFAPYAKQFRRKLTPR
ncbi:MAG: hypothetical protein FWF25_00655 [Propionibacteriaceae bacterium]|nr:hypothetical protein [Propionibacteriaceae bacterium]